MRYRSAPLTHQRLTRPIIDSDFPIPTLPCTAALTLSMCSGNKRITSSTNTPSHPRGMQVLLMSIALTLCWAHAPVIHHRGLVPPVNCSASAPPVLSYHVHVVYNIFDDGQVSAAGALRDLARRHFHNDVGPDCDCHGPQPDPDGMNCRYDDGILCFILDHPINETLHGALSLAFGWLLIVRQSLL